MDRATRAGANEIEGAEVPQIEAGAEQGSQRPKLRLADKVAERAAAKKAGARLFAKDGFPDLKFGGLDYVAALATCLLIKGQEGTGISEAVFLDWYEFEGDQSQRLKRIGAELVEAGYIERFAHRQGHAVDITAKGRRLLDYYEREHVQVLDEMEGKRVVNQLEGRTREMERKRTRRIGEARTRKARETAAGEIGIEETSEPVRVPDKEGLSRDEYRSRARSRPG